MNENPFTQCQELPEARPTTTQEETQKKNDILAKKAILFNSTQATQLSFKQLKAYRDQYASLKSAIERTQEAIKCIRNERQTSASKSASFEGYISSLSSITSTENIFKTQNKDKIIEQRKNYLELCESEKKELKKKFIEFQFLKENKETIDKEIEVNT